MDIRVVLIMSIVATVLFCFYEIKRYQIPAVAGSGALW